MAIVETLPLTKPKKLSSGQIAPPVNGHGTKTLWRGKDLPGSDGEPMENARERLQENLGNSSLTYVWQDRQDYYSGCNMFVYYSQEQADEVLAEMDNPARPKRTFRGPDMFVVLGVDGSYRRQKWVVWEEEDRYPDVIFEFLSPSTRSNDLGDKKRLYEQTFRTAEYFCFEYMDPDREDNLIGFRLDAQGNYQPIEANENGWLWSEQLGLWVGTWYGTYDQDTTTWMRFYTPEGKLVPTQEEAAEAAQREAEAAQREAEAAQREAEAAQREAEARAESEATARQAMEDENARLRAELARLRGES